MQSPQPIRNCSYFVAILLLTMLCASLSATLAFGGPHPRRGADYKRQVESLEEQWRTTQLANDVTAMDKLLSDDYIGISMNGQVFTKAQQLDRMRDKDLVLTRIDFDDMKVKLIGPIAIVTSRTQVEGTSDGEPVKGTFRYTRVYKRLPSGSWKITSFEATRARNTVASVDKAPQPN